MIDMLNLPSLGEIESADPEVDEAQAKKDRIAFHRERVRNGPVSFKQVTNGQIRRARLRELQGRTLKARRAQVRDFLSRSREVANLRGHLQAIGVLEYVTDYQPSEEARFRSARALVGRFGDMSLAEDGDALLRDAIQKAYDRYATLTGQETSPVEFLD